MSAAACMGLCILELVREAHLDISRCFLIFQKCLVSWFIGCIADIDPKHIVH